MWSGLSSEERLVTMKSMGLNKITRQTTFRDAPDLVGTSVREVASKTLKMMWAQLCGVKARIQLYREEITQILETVLPSVEFPEVEVEVVDSSSDDAAQSVFDNDTPYEATDATEETAEEAAQSPRMIPWILKSPMRLGRALYPWWGLRLHPVRSSSPVDVESLID
jgi:hypothetical protein